jgi:phospholipid transport system substrate-binding protein
MLDRRRFLVLAVPGAIASASAARAQADPAVAFIQRRGEQLLAIINGPAPTAQKQQEVARLLTETVDMDGVGRFVVGRYWRTASAQEQREFLKLFQDLLVETISARFGELKGLKFQVTGPTRRDEESQGVATVIERPGQPPAAVEWRIADQGGALKVVDLIAEGTSLRLTQRGEYTAVLQRNSGRFDALLGAMKRQLAQLQQS